MVPAGPGEGDVSIPDEDVPQGPFGGEEDTGVEEGTVNEGTEDEGNVNIPDENVPQGEYNEGDMTEPQPAEEDEEDVPPLAVADEEETGYVDIDDESLPLVSPEIAIGTKHCVTHILEYILAGGVTAYGVGNSRKQKKEIKELKKGKRG